MGDSLPPSGSIYFPVPRKARPIDGMRTPRDAPIQLLYYNGMHGSIMACLLYGFVISNNCGDSRKKARRHHFAEFNWNFIREFLSSPPRIPNSLAAYSIHLRFNGTSRSIRTIPLYILRNNLVRLRGVCSRLLLHTKNQSRSVGKQTWMLLNFAGTIREPARKHDVSLHSWLAEILRISVPLIPECRLLN